MTDLADTIARVRQRAESLTAERAAAAQSNRTRYPEFAAWVDDFRRVFGEVKVRRFEVLA